jgi:hypothetical protein
VTLCCGGMEMRPVEAAILPGLGERMVVRLLARQVFGARRSGRSRFLELRIMSKA